MESSSVSLIPGCNAGTAYAMLNLVRRRWMCGYRFASPLTDDPTPYPLRDDDRHDVCKAATFLTSFRFSNKRLTLERSILRRAKQMSLLMQVPDLSIRRYLRRKRANSGLTDVHLRTSVKRKTTVAIIHPAFQTVGKRLSPWTNGPRRRKSACVARLAYSDGSIG